MRWCWTITRRRISRPARYTMLAGLAFQCASFSQGYHENVTMLSDFLDPVYIAMFTIANPSILRAMRQTQNQVGIWRGWAAAAVCAWWGRTMANTTNSFPLHSDEIACLPGRTVIAASGLVVTGLSVTGLLQWWRIRGRR
jgi:hypothetical protein